MPATPTSPSRRRPGRPRGGASGARERILAAAAAEFGEQGYDGATVRAIAERAHVDPALVHHYFGAKQALFAAALDLPVDPIAGLPAVFAGDLDTAGERIVGYLLHTWDDPAFRRRGVAALRAVLGSRRGAALIVGFVSREIVGQLGARIGPGEEGRRRATLVASQLLGLIVTRYVLEFEPLASDPVDRLVAAIGPTVQRYLTGALD